MHGARGGQQVLKENKIWSTMAVLDREENGGEHSIISVPDYKEDALINYRGASSYSQFDKKQYRIKFYKKKGSGKPRDIAFLGMGKNSEWVLNGPYLDKTLVRNKLVYDLGRETMDWAPDTRFVDLLNERYLELRETVLSEEHIFSLLDSYERELGGAIDRNFAVWGYTFELNLLNEQREDGSGRDFKSYEEAKKQLRDTIQSRLLFLDQHMTDLYDNVVN